MISRTTRAVSNLRMLEFIAPKLGTLKEEVVFLGGCATALSFIFAVFCLPKKLKFADTP